MTDGGHRRTDGQGRETGAARKRFRSNECALIRDDQLTRKAAASKKSSFWDNVKVFRDYHSSKSSTLLKATTT